LQRDALVITDEHGDHLFTVPLMKADTSAD
jgi:hypothetical protein